MDTIRETIIARAEQLGLTAYAISQQCGGSPPSPQCAEASAWLGTITHPLPPRRNGRRGSRKINREYLRKLLTTEFKPETKPKKEPNNMQSTGKRISQPPDWWDVFQSEADRAGVSLSSWIGTCCLNTMRCHKRGQAKVAKLSKRPLASRPPKKGGAK